MIMSNYHTLFSNLCLKYFFLFDVSSNARLLYRCSYLRHLKWSTKTVGDLYRWLFSLQSSWDRKPGSGYSSWSTKMPCPVDVTVWVFFASILLVRHGRLVMNPSMHHSHFFGFSLAILLVIIPNLANIFILLRVNFTRPRFYHRSSAWGCLLPGVLNCTQLFFGDQEVSPSSCPLTGWGSPHWFLPVVTKWNFYFLILVICSNCVKILAADMLIILLMVKFCVYGLREDAVLIGLFWLS